MARARVLIGTRKGAFIATGDGRRASWTVDGPHFGGWEIYHVHGSPADPDRLYTSQSSAWSGQVVQRSDDGGRTWTAVVSGQEPFRVLGAIAGGLTAPVRCESTATVVAHPRTRAERGTG